MVEDSAVLDRVYRALGDPTRRRLLAERAAAADSPLASAEAWIAEQTAFWEGRADALAVELDRRRRR